MSQQCEVLSKLTKHPLAEVPLSADQPDLLGLEPLAKVIFKSLQRADELDSRMLGVFGPWGSGKTTLLGMIKKQCDADIADGKSKWLWLTFDAWVHQTEKMLVLAIVHAVAKKGDRAIEDALAKLAFAAGFGLGNLILAAASGGTLSLEKVKQVLAADKGVESELSKEEAIRKAFGEIVANVLKARGVEHVVVAVDNLDRCRPEIAISVLESLHIIQEVEKCTFVVTADQDVLSSFLNRAYEGTALNGARYLEKVFPDYFRIPDPWVQRDVTKVSPSGDKIWRLIEATFPREGAWNRSDPNLTRRLWVHCSQPRVLRNPRRIKRILRRLSLMEEQVEFTVPLLDGVLFLIVLSDVWPEAYGFFQHANRTQWQLWLHEFSPGFSGVKTKDGCLAADEDFKKYVIAIIESVPKAEYELEDLNHLRNCSGLVASLGL